MARGVNPRRMIDTGRGRCWTDMTPGDIAARRAGRLSGGREDAGLFLRTFSHIRNVAASLTDPEDLWTVMGGSLVNPVMEAAAIEALASLRAEGVRL